jgi:DNA adenine methylase
MRGRAHGNADHSVARRRATACRYADPAVSSCYVEVFFGAAELFLMRPPVEVEVLNDVHNDLINLSRVVQHQLEEFVTPFESVLSSRQVFTPLSNMPPRPVTDIRRAARFYYLQQNSFWEAG